MTTIKFPADGHLKLQEHLSLKDYQWVESLAGMEQGDELFASFGDDELASALHSLAVEILDEDPVGIFWHLQTREKLVQRYGYEGPYAQLMFLGLDYAVMLDDADCCNYLGACYYMGGQAGVPQSYEEAKNLYERASALGSVQATINLGYIYEYGRTGEPDYAKAHQQYTKAAALYAAPEALYKLGDLYNRGRGVEREVKTAYLLYERSLDVASDYAPEIKGQAAFRVAELVGDKVNEILGIPYQPLRALELYQLAERGLRVDIAKGQTHYLKRLQQAVEGQDRMREALTQEILLG